MVTSRTEPLPLNTEEQKQLREALHAMNNALNAISMQAELARLYAESHDIGRINEALSVIMAQSRQLSGMTHRVHTLLISPE
jgi:hypothetical protein